MSSPSAAWAGLLPSPAASTAAASVSLNNTSSLTTASTIRMMINIIHNNKDVNGSSGYQQQKQHSNHDNSNKNIKDKNQQQIKNQSETAVDVTAATKSSIKVSRSGLISNALAPALSASTRTTSITTTGSSTSHDGVDDGSRSTPKTGCGAAGNVDNNEKNKMDRESNCNNESNHDNKMRTDNRKK